MTQRIGVIHNIIAVNLVVEQIEAEGRLNHRDLHRRGRHHGYGDAGRLVS
jgi:nitrate reductase NapAB chaperone NapD